MGTRCPSNFVSAFTREHAVAMQLLHAPECWSPREIWCCVCRTPINFLIRVGLGGNLCHSQAMSALSRAVQSVIDQRRAHNIAPPDPAR